MVAHLVENLPAMQETQVRSLSQEDTLEKERATDSSIFAQEIRWGLQGRFPGDFQSLCWIPRLGCLTWGSEPSHWEMTFLLLLFSSLWVTYLAGMEFDFMVTVSLLLPHCGFFFVFGCLFLVCSSILLLMVVVGREKISQGGMFRLSHPTFCK